MRIRITTSHVARPETCLRCNSLCNVANVYTAELFLQKLHVHHYFSCISVDIYRYDISRHAVATEQLQLEDEYETLFLLLNDQNSFDRCRIVFHIQRSIPFTEVIRGVPQSLQKHANVFYAYRRYWEFDFLRNFLYTNINRFLFSV